MKFYLSGGMEFQEGLGKDWREYITKKLGPLGHDVFDPVKVALDVNGEEDPFFLRDKRHTNMEEYKDEIRRLMFHRDIKGIQESDAVVLMYDRSAQLGAGTLAEAWESFREGKPVYIVTRFDLATLSGWLIGECIEIFPSFSEFIEHIEVEGQLESDIKQAEYNRVHYLKGVYKL